MFPPTKHELCNSIESLRRTWKVFVQSLIDRFYTNYTTRDIITYRRDYAIKKLKEFEQALSELGDKNKLENWIMNDTEKMNNREKLAIAIFCQYFLYTNEFITFSNFKKIHDRLRDWQYKNKVKVTEAQLDSIEVIYDDNATYDDVKENKIW